MPEVSDERQLLQDAASSSSTRHGQIFASKIAHSESLIEFQLPPEDDVDVIVLHVALDGATILNSNEFTHLTEFVAPQSMKSFLEGIDLLIKEDSPLSLNACTVSFTATFNSPFDFNEAIGILFESFTVWAFYSSPNTSSPQVDVTLTNLNVCLLSASETLMLEEVEYHLVEHVRKLKEPIICHICEQTVQPWFFEKHSELCLESHRLQNKAQIAHDNLMDHMVTISPILDHIVDSQQNIGSKSNDSSKKAGILRHFSSMINIRNINRIRNEYAKQILDLINTALNIELPNLTGPNMKITENTCNSNIPQDNITSDSQCIRKSLDYLDLSLFDSNSASNITKIITQKALDIEDPSLKSIATETQKLVLDKISSLLDLSQNLLDSENVRIKIESEMKERQRANIEAVHENSISRPISVAVSDTETSAQYLPLCARNNFLAFRSQGTNSLAQPNSHTESIPVGRPTLYDHEGDIEANITRYSSHSSKHLRTLSDTSECSFKFTLGASKIATTPVLPTTASIKDFEILKPISRGAFGSVYLARKKLTGEHFAIKVLRKADMIAKNQVTNIRAERAILIAQGNKDYVTKLFWTFMNKDHLYLVLEFLCGGDCAALIKNLKVLPEDWIKRYLAEMVLIIESLHMSGIVHRDLKPDNFLLDSKGHLKLTDFGLSKMGVFRRQTSQNVKPQNTPNEKKWDALDHKSIVFDSSWSATDESYNSQNYETHQKFNESVSPRNSFREKLPSSFDQFNHRISSMVEDMDTLHFSSLSMFDRKNNIESFVGTPDYIAPEIIKGIEQDQYCDWWSLGCILFEFCYGYPPFNASNLQQIFENIIDCKIQWPKEQALLERVSFEARDLISKLLIPNFWERLGYDGTIAIKDHAFFKDLDFNKLYDTDGPLVPNCENIEDLAYFDPRGVRPYSQIIIGAVDSDTREGFTNQSEDSLSSCSEIDTTNPAFPIINITPSKQSRSSHQRSDSFIDKFGSFSYKNIDALERANQNAIQKLRLQYRSSSLAMSPPITSSSQRNSMNSAGALSSTFSWRGSNATSAGTALSERRFTTTSAVFDQQSSQQHNSLPSTSGFLSFKPIDTAVASNLHNTQFSNHLTIPTELNKQLASYTWDDLADSEDRELTLNE